MADDFYQILGVERGASPEEIKRAYRGLARQFHPDVNPDPEAEEKFKELSHAYSVLSDANQRARYDQFGPEGLRNGVGGGAGATGFGFPFDLEDLISSFFGGGVSRAETERGADLRYDLELTLEEVLTGCERRTQVTKPEYCDACEGSGAEPGYGQVVCPSCGGAGRVSRVQNTLFGQFSTATSCPHCRGTGRVVEKPCSKCGGEGRSVQEVTLTITVPPGVEEGDRMRLRGQGEAGRRGAPPGDLYVVCHIKEHPRFERRGAQLAVETPISFSQAALGDVLEIEGLDGSPIRVEIPAGTQTGAHFAHRGQGLPSVRKPQSRGDLHVFVRVYTPTNLSAEEKELLRKFAELRDEDVPEPSSRGFFQKVWDRLVGE